MSSIAAFSCHRRRRCTLSREQLWRKVTCRYKIYAQHTGHHAYAGQALELRGFVNYPGSVVGKKGVPWMVRGLSSEARIG